MFMPKLCSIDIETYCDLDLKKTGAYRYAEHESCELMCMAYQFDDGPVNLWVPHAIHPSARMFTIEGELHEGEIPPELLAHVVEGRELRAHNAAFERVVLNRIGPRYGFPMTPIEQWTCTAVKAAYHNILRDLKGAAKELGGARKDEAGRNVMLQLCRPRRGVKSRWEMEDVPEKFADLYSYCIDDVRAEHGIDTALRDIPEAEQRLYALDQRMNDRGVKIDVESVDRVLALYDEHRDVLNRQCEAITGGVTASQTLGLAEWIREQGYDIENLRSATITEALKDNNLPDNIRTVLNVRAAIAAKGPAKYMALKNAVGADGRLRGMFMFYGASTGRWSSKIVQMQNMHRGYIKDPDTAIDAYRHGLDFMWMLYGIDPIKVFSSTVRGMLIAEEGHDIIAADYSQIEARVLPWLAGQVEILRAFESGRDLYKHTASTMFGVPYESVSDQQRFIGKVIVLACGYQGGPGAFLKMAANFGVEFPEDEVKNHIYTWRDANAKIVSAWYEADNAAREAIKYKDTRLCCDGKLAFRSDGRFLKLRLPSGRVLHWFKPHINEDGQIAYTGVDTFSRKWGRTSTYGGSLIQSATQAIARDIMAHGALNMEAADYPVVGTVHDEVWTEVREDFGSVEEVCNLMCDAPDWAEGLPVKASGFRAKRYRK